MSNVGFPGVVELFACASGARVCRVDILLSPVLDNIWQTNPPFTPEVTTSHIAVTSNLWNWLCAKQCTPMLASDRRQCCRD